MLPVREFTNGSDVLTHAAEIRRKFYGSRQDAPTQVLPTTEKVVAGLVVAVETLDAQMSSRITHAEFSEEVGVLKSALAAVQAELAMIRRMICEDTKAADNVRKARRRGAMAPILTQVLDAFNISKGDLCSGRRSTHLVRARFAFMYLARTYTQRSYPEIGRMLGGRDHTTVMHGCSRAEAILASDDDFRATVQAIVTNLQLGADND